MNCNSKCCTVVCAGLNDHQMYLDQKVFNLKISKNT